MEHVAQEPMARALGSVGLGLSLSLHDMLMSVLGATRLRAVIGMCGRDHILVCIRYLKLPLGEVGSSERGHTGVYFLIGEQNLVTILPIISHHDQTKILGEQNNIWGCRFR